MKLKKQQLRLYSILAILLFAFVLFIALPLELTDQETPPQEIPPVTEEPEELKEPDPYSLLFEDLVLTIKENLSAEELYAALGKPIAEVIEEVDDGGDSFQGAVVHSLTYEGITIYLFSPQKEPEAFWLMSMTATGSAIHTPKEIAVGSTLAELQNAYPDLEELPYDFVEEGNPQYYLVHDWEAMKAMQFKILNNQVAQINVYVEMP